MTPQYLLDYLPVCKGFEGDIQWMYLDSVGNVTVGVGFMLPTSLAACTYPFYLGAALAVTEDITAAWDKVKAMEANRPAEFYDYVGALVMRQADIDKTLLSILDQTDAALLRDYPGFELWPEYAKMAAVDMDYNLGDAKLRNTYPKFDAAADRMDFTTMAAQCHRNGISTERNAWTIRMFEQAASGA